MDKIKNVCEKIVNEMSNTVNINVHYDFRKDLIVIDFDGSFTIDQLRRIVEAADG